MRANLCLFVFLGLGGAFWVGCASTRGDDPEPLTESDRELLQDAERLLFRNDPSWFAVWQEFSARPVPSDLFTRGLIAWLIQDYRSIASSPDAFEARLEVHPRAEKWRLALRALARIGAPAAEQAWRVVTEGREFFARAMGAEILGRLGPAALPILLAGLESPEVPEAVAAARGLGLHRGALEAGRALIRAAGQHPDYRVRGEALEALGKHGGPDAQAALVLALRREKDPFALRKAVEGLRLLGEEATVPTLIEFLEARHARGDEEGVQAALRALRSITGRNLGPRPDRWRLWWAQRARLDVEH